MASASSDWPGSPDDLDDVFHALSNRTRRAILLRLADRPATVGGLAEPFAMSLPAVSKHLKVLERARLVSRSVDGRRHCCALEPGGLQVADDWLAPYREFWTGQFEALGRHLRPRPPARRRTATSATPGGPGVRARRKARPATRPREPRTGPPKDI